MNTPTCSICNSPLILISEETFKPEGSRFMQKNTLYRCSNDECQNLKDKEKEKRLLVKQKKDISDKERLEAAQEKRALAQQMKLDAQKS